MNCAVCGHAKPASWRIALAAAGLFAAERWKKGVTWDCPQIKVEAPNWVARIGYLHSGFPSGVNECQLKFPNFFKWACLIDIRITNPRVKEVAFSGCLAI